MTRLIFRVMLLVAVVGTSAQAQLGSLIKKAAGKLEGKAENKVEERATAKPLEGDPVTPETLDAVLKGLAFEVGQQVEAVRLHDLQQKKWDEFNAADKAGRSEADAYRNKNSKVMDCVHRSLQAQEEQHSEEISQKFMTLGSDPKMQQTIRQMVDVQQRIAEAMKTKDTAAVRRLTAQYFRVLGMDPVKDSVVAFQKCGKLPEPPASYVLTERLRKELNDMNEDLRKVEMDLSDKAATKAGMPAKEYFLARERLWAWNSVRNDKFGGGGGVTKDENALFKSRSADIKKVEKALR